MIRMRARKEWFIVMGLSLAAVLATLLPYLWAVRLARPEIFGGFLINPTDGYSYLAKMRQGWAGSWSFVLPYTADPGEGAFLFVYYLLLGHLARILSLTLLTVYHAARLLAGLWMFTLAFVFFARVLPSRRSRWMGFLLSLFGSGLGWFALSFDVTTSDLTIPESIPFLAAYTNAHFPLAAASTLWIVLCVLQTKRTLLACVGAACGATVLAAVLPFSALGLGAVLAVWLIWEMWWIARRSDKELSRRALITKTLPVLAYFIAVAPWGIYDLWVQSRHPVLQLWAEQNLTPSPPLLHYLLGFGLVLALAVVGLATARLHREASGRLLLVWVLVTGLMLYAPFPLQRRLSLGVFFPLAGLAAVGFERVFVSRRRMNLAFVTLLLLSIPSNIVVMSVGMLSVREREPLMVLTTQELATYRWMENNLPEEELVLASPLTGNRLPAFTSARVLVGHPFETPMAQEQERLVRDLYASTESPDQVLDRLHDLGVDAVVFGPSEARLGPARWLEQTNPAFQAGEVRVYKIPDRP